MTHALRAFLAKPALALVEIAEAQGSTPREAGAWMLVSSDAIFGTIGGGQLEYMAIDEARRVLAAEPSPLWGGSPAGRGGGSSALADNGTPTPTLRVDPPHKGEGKPSYLTIPLGPEIGQCCGGRVKISIHALSEPGKAMLLAKAEADDARLPHVYLFGGGHVGHALAAALALLPVRAVVVETRKDELVGLPDNVEARLTAMPEEIVREAPRGSAYLVLTHDHALDFLIVAEALKRTDAAHVGMIGSLTKRATFRSWYLKSAEGDEMSLARLVSPIGGVSTSDKRPAVIAAMAAAELMTALANWQNSSVKNSVKHRKKLA